MELSESAILRTKAEGDLFSAKAIYDANDELTGIICYHIQQYVEKMLKAKLIELNIPYKKTHDIGSLMELFPDERLSRGFIKEADRLTGYCVNTRYENYDPSIEEMNEAFIIAEKIVSISESIKPENDQKKN